MDILLDSGNIDEIKEALTWCNIDGFTTNPSILANSPFSPEEIFSFFKANLKNRTMHMQVTGRDAEKMIKQGKAMHEYFGKNFFVKIPVTQEGLKATRELKRMGLGVTVTSVFTLSQGVLAAKNGADYIAPYVHKIDNISGNGVEVALEISNYLRNTGYSAKTLAAGFKNVRQIDQLAMGNCQSATITPEILRDILSHPHVDKSLSEFENNWQRKFGEKSVDYLIPNSKK